MPKKSKRARIERILKDREPKINENPKKALIIKGTKPSQTAKDVIKELARLKDPYVVRLQKNNEYLPFEDPSPFEFLSEKNDCSLFLFATNSKKRPDNIVMGRLFDSKILDLLEFGVENFVSMTEIKGLKAPFGHKPSFIFQGDQFENDDIYRNIKNLIIDFFHIKDEEVIDQEGVDLIISCSVLNSKIFFRTYCCATTPTQTKYPKIDLIPQGPNFDMVIRRTQFADEDVRKQACRVPKQKMVKKVKNISHSVFGDKIGTIHMDKQNFEHLQTRKMKGLKRKRESNDNGDKERDDDDDDDVEEAEEEE